MGLFVPFLTVKTYRQNGMVGSRRRTVEDIVQIEELHTLQALPQDTPARCHGGALEDLETYAVQATRIQDLEKKWKEVKRGNVVLAGRLNMYKVSLRSRETKLEEDQPKNCSCTPSKGWSRSARFSLWNWSCYLIPQPSHQ